MVLYGVLDRICYAKQTIPHLPNEINESKSMKTANGTDPDNETDELGTCEWHDSPEEYQPYHFTPNNRPQDGQVCNCEDAPCCGHYEL
jgi:hypothetical protein